LLQSAGIDHWKHLVCHIAVLFVQHSQRDSIDGAGDLTNFITDITVHNYHLVFAKVMRYFDSHDTITLHT
jgi:hypothetical protein